MDFKYRNLDDNTIEITDYTGSATNLIVLSTIDGCTVASIGKSAFAFCTSLTSVTIPNSVTSIGWGAFEYCSNLTSINIPNSVTRIGRYAFYECSNLTSITIPNSVTSIRDYAFCGCSSLTSVTIPDSVISIGYEAFYNCSKLTSVTISNSVTSIGNYAFYLCTSLTSITIPDSVTSIGESAFRGCTSLKTIKANYKAFDLKNNKLVCRDYEFIENQWSKEIKGIALCQQGYHFCTNLFELFNYYWGEIDKNIAIYECEVGDKVIESETSKCVTNKIKPVKRLYREDVARILNGGDINFADKSKFEDKE